MHSLLYFCLSDLGIIDVPLGKIELLKWEGWVNAWIILEGIFLFSHLTSLSAFTKSNPIQIQFPLPFYLFIYSSHSIRRSTQSAATFQSNRKYGGWREWLDGLANEVEGIYGGMELLFTIVEVEMCIKFSWEIVNNFFHFFADFISQENIGSSFPVCYSFSRTTSQIYSILCMIHSIDCPSNNKFASGGPKSFSPWSPLPF